MRFPHCVRARVYVSISFFVLFCALFFGRFFCDYFVFGCTFLGFFCALLCFFVLSVLFRVFCAFCAFLRFLCFSLVFFVLCWSFLCLFVPACALLWFLCALVRACVFVVISGALSCCAFSNSPCACLGLLLLFAALRVVCFPAFTPLLGSILRDAVTLHIRRRIPHLGLRWRFMVFLNKTTTNRYILRVSEMGHS